MSAGADTRASTTGWYAPERGHVALLERLAQLGDALAGVGAVAFIIEAAEPVHGQAATQERGVSMAADTKANALGRGALERGHVALLERLAQLGDALGGVGAAAEDVEAAELVPGQAATRERGVSMGVDTKANTQGWGGALEGGDLRLLEDCSERGGALDSDAVGGDTARDGWGHSERADASER